MERDPRVPLHVAFDVGQGEGTVYLLFELARRGFRGLLGYRDGRLLLRCAICEASFSVPHSPAGKQPFSLRFTPDGESVECVSCRDAWGVEPLATEAM